MARLVMEGARSICESAGIPLAGGHSIDSTEPLFGLSVNGMVGVENLKRNNTAKSGDYIFLTKPLGTGILATAIKRNLMDPDSLGGFYAQITKLNKIGEVLGPLPEVHAVTDVTGFGLMGHLIEMAEGSNLSAEINFGQLSLMEGVKHLLGQNIIPDATYRNWNAYSEKTLINPDVNQVESFQILPDPQTNVGLLFSVAPSFLQEIQNLLREHGYENHVLPIGRFVDPMEKTLYVLP
jgi:selenide,water dikinase